VKNRQPTAVVLRSLLSCLLIIGVLAGNLAVVTLQNPVAAAATMDTAQQSQAGHVYLFHDPVQGTELYVDTGSVVYRFTAPDGYDTGTVRAVRMLSKSNLIVINDRVKGFNFNCNIDFKENLCHGQVSDRRDGGYLRKYSIFAPVAGAELPDQPIVPSTTVVLGQTTLDCLSVASEDFSVLNFTDTTRQLSSLSVGDVIVSGVSNMTPYGLLRQVTDVVFNGDQVVVETVPATLEDAIQECDIHGTWSLLPDGSTTPLEMVASQGCQECTLSPDANVQLDSTGCKDLTALTESCTGWYIDIDDVVLFDADEDPGTKDDQVVASGSLCANVDVDIGLKVEDWALREAHFLVTTSEAAELQIALKVTIAELHEKAELYRQYLTPITLWAGPVPIVFAPVLTFNVGIDAEVSTDVATSISSTADVTVGVSYAEGTWSPVTDHFVSFGWDTPSLTAGCEVKGYLGPQLALLLYGVTGPYAEVRGYLELEADLFDTPWWKLYGGVEADVGFRVEVLGHDIADYEVPAAIGYRVLLAQAETGTPVDFPDPNLEAAIREAIGKPTGPIYPSDLVGLTSLSASLKSITNLTGLEHCINLTELDLEGNQISDISPLANLTNLTYLYLRDNQISDISALANLINLTLLDLCFNQISDLFPLTNLTSLTELYLGANHISDISPLGNLTNLTYLGLWDNQISDILPLANLANLTFLALSVNQISDISPLGNLTNLTLLELKSNQISDILPLANLANLTRLGLSDNQISDISPLTNVTSLTELYLGDNHISDISPLANLTNLMVLYLNNNQISDISALVDNIGLGTWDHVYLTGNPLSSASITIYIPQLQARGVTVYY